MHLMRHRALSRKRQAAHRPRVHPAKQSPLAWQENRFPATPPLRWALFCFMHQLGEGVCPSPILCVFPGCCGRACYSAMPKCARISRSVFPCWIICTAPGGGRVAPYLLSYAQSVSQRTANSQFLDAKASRKAKKEAHRMVCFFFGSPCWT